MYDIFSPDLHDAFQEEHIGQVSIDVDHETLTFRPLQSWLNTKYYPPEIWLLSEEERKANIDEHYRDYHGGLWSRAVYMTIMKRMRRKEFPKIFSWGS